MASKISFPLSSVCDPVPYNAPSGCAVPLNEGSTATELTEPPTKVKTSVPSVSFSTLFLFDAQLNKYQKIAESLNLNENSEVLEIGCGWGGFSTYAAKNFKSKIDAITISKAQFEYASKKIQKEGLGEKVKIKFKD